MTNADIRQTVNYAMGSPEYLSFNRACFVTAQLAGRTTEEVIAIASDLYTIDMMIDEAKSEFIPLISSRDMVTGELIDIEF